MKTYLEVVDAAKLASSKLELSKKENRNLALKSISEAIIKNAELILEANKIDLDNASSISPVMKKRLSLTKEKLISISNDVIEVSKLDEVVGKTLETINRPNGLVIKKESVPFGVILAIFESRPNVCIDIASLCIKTGNVCILRGGKEAINTNKAIVKIIRDAIKDLIPEDSVNLIYETDREIVNELITMKDKIDLVVPRGSKGLIDTVCNNATVPVIETGAGTCHLYIDESADLNMALNITMNAKLSNPAVCNAVECIIVNRKVANEYFALLKGKEFDKIVNVHGDIEVRKYIECSDVSSYYTEFNDTEVNIKLVDNVDEAISHISVYGTKHSEVIVTENEENALKFMSSIDAACVYWNASSRFSDGGCFGFGAELGISTGKMHARGPMGLKEMVTYKYKIFGNGQIRK